MALVSYSEAGKLKELHIPPVLGEQKLECLSLNRGRLTVNGVQILPGSSGTILGFLSDVRPGARVIEYIFLSETHGTINVRVPLTGPTQSIQAEKTAPSEET